MRVLHLYSGNLFGGIETFLVTLARHADYQPDIKHEFALCFDGRLKEELNAAGATVIQLNPIRLRQPLSVFRARRAVAKLLRTTPKYDVVICHSSWAQAIFAPVVKRSRRPNVYYLHGPVNALDWPDRLAKRIVPALMIGVSQDTLRSGRKLYPTVRGEVVNYPIPWNMTGGAAPGAREKLRREMGVDGSTVIISQISRLDRWKGQDLLLESLARLCDLPGWTCWIAGGAQRPQEAQFLSELHEATDRLGLRERVRFIGDRRDVPNVLAATDLYCQANRGPEGFSLAFMEAFTAGRPIVTTDLGGASELIDERSGVLTPPGDADALAGALRTLVKDAALRERMGEAARARVADVSDPRRQIERLAEILSSVSIIDANLKI